MSLERAGLTPALFHKELGMEEAAAHTAQGLIESLGFPIAMVVILLGAMFIVARAIKGWIDKKDVEAITREARYADKLDAVQADFHAFQTATAKDCSAAMNRMADIGEGLKEQGAETKTMVAALNETMRDVRRELQGSSDRRRAVG